MDHTIHTGFCSSLATDGAQTKYVLSTLKNEITTSVIVDDSSKDISLTTKLYVDEQDQKLYQDIIRTRTRD